MRQLKTLLLAALLLVFVAGVGTGAWIGSLAAAAPGPKAIDRRAREFQRVYDLSPTQMRQLREILYDNDQKKEAIRQAPEVLQAIWTVEAESRARIREILTEEQRAAYDRRAQTR